MEQGPRQYWWLIAVVITVVERIATFANFIPTMVRLNSASDVSDEVRAGLTRWLLVNNGRHVLTLAGWLAALKALSMPAL